MKTEVVLKFATLVLLLLDAMFNENRGCIEIESKLFLMLQNLV